ncbi:MAG: response regulator [Nitrospirota bacterium]
MPILIVEDNPVNARLLVLMLKSHGYQTVVAGNGKEALATLSETPDIQLIITDYMMPEMDGLEFIVKVRALPTWSPIPILVASAHADLDTVKRVQGLQCDSFLVKPIDKKQLIKRVEHLLQSQPLVLLGKQKTMDRLDIGPAEYHELVNAFVAQLAATIPIVVLEQGGLEEPISENLGRLLKELAESSSTLGADKFLLLYSKCMGRGLPARSQCPALLKALQELETSLLAYIQSQPNAVAKN